jgi:hypothetical protein
MKDETKRRIREADGQSKAQHGAKPKAQRNAGVARATNSKPVKRATDVWCGIEIPVVRVRGLERLIHSLPSTRYAFSSARTGLYSVRPLRGLDSSSFQHHSCLTSLLYSQCLLNTYSLVK